MRSLTICLLFASACGNIIPVPDQGATANACQLPSQCFTTSASANPCACSRGSIQPGGSCVQNLVTNVDGGNCIPGDPLSQYPTLCFCPADSQCLEPAQVCIGRGVVCHGACRPPSDMGCTAPVGGVNQVYPPQLVAVGTDGGLVYEPHCTFTDDVCDCPPLVGTDMSVSSPDMSATVTDMAAHD